MPTPTAEYVAKMRELGRKRRNRFLTDVEAGAMDDVIALLRADAATKRDTLDVLKQLKELAEVRRGER
jgi:hypothetical protein